MEQNNWYKNYFTKFYYDLFCATKEDEFDEEKEVNFICNIFKLPQKAKVLDLACGHGRHAIKLAQRGYRVTGVDFNKNYLQIARKEAQRKGVYLKLVQCDMREISFTNEFDAVIMMYTSFGYFKNERDNMKVLKLARKSLKKGGSFLLDVPNKKWVIEKAVGKTWNKINGDYVLENRILDKEVLKDEIIVINPKGKLNNLSSYVRLYGLEDIKNRLKKAGMKYIKAFGDYDIKVNYNSLKTPRMIVLAKSK
jgi:ubiquinone/menaquinone biosynthesis C-methylase UbiE